MIYATSNQSKLNEVNQALGQSIQGLSSKDKKIDVLETGSTYLENARIKAKFYADLTGHAVVSDDGGLELALFPERLGLKTSRSFSKDWSDYEINKEILSWYQAEESDRRATLVTALAYYEPGKNNPSYETEIRIDFLLSQEIRGSYGYGFDSILLIEEINQTVSEIKDTKERQKYSSRTQAFKKLMEFIEE